MDSSNLHTDHVTVISALNVCVTVYTAQTATDTVSWWILISGHALNRMSVLKVFVSSCADYGLFGNTNAFNFEVYFTFILL
jgi:hypothetical protein